MSFPRFTTPTLVFTFSDENLDLTQASSIMLSLTSMKTGAQVDKPGEELTIQAKRVDCDLTQEESGLLAAGKVLAKLHWKLPSGKRGASEDRYFDVTETNYKKVM